jgi:hypothetical protein
MNLHTPWLPNKGELLPELISLPLVNMFMTNLQVDYAIFVFVIISYISYNSYICYRNVI